MKTHELMISKTFMKGHPAAGSPTWFAERIYEALVDNPQAFYSDRAKTFNNRFAPKIHTIRANYGDWKKKIDEVCSGEACLVLKQWSGLPYRSKKSEIITLRRTDLKKDDAPYAGVGCQLIECIAGSWFVDHKRVAMKRLAENDGLHLSDFSAWFPQNFEDYALIHFTPYRY